ncbi:MAG: hypothetical protein E7Z97_01210 [Propionibacteriaceae bacterium]|nr:hypothetical protein [Propionibacteriaceae bacterium]
MSTDTTLNDRIRGAVLGSAWGDAWGRPTEFWSFEQIEQADPAPSDPLVVSDDTQMCLATNTALTGLIASDEGRRALLALPAGQGWDLVREAFAHRYIAWRSDPDNDRAPGRACLAATGKLELLAAAGGARSWREGALGNDSKGCGTTMRAPWAGLLGLPEPVTAAVSFAQSQITHDHPMSWVAAAVVALLTQHCLALDETARLRDFGLVGAAERAIEVVRPLAGLGSPAERAGVVAACDELAAHLARVRSLWDEFAADRGDPCLFFGQGWVADEALVTATAVTQRAIDAGDPADAVRRLVHTGGDSDSMAILGGAFVGAAWGFRELWAGLPVEGHFEPRYERELAEAVVSIEAARAALQNATPPGA